MMTASTPHPTAALGAYLDVDVEAATQKGRPFDSRTRCVEDPSEQSIPVLHREYIRRECDDVAGSADAMKCIKAGRRGAAPRRLVMLRGPP
jgi:hypothetical protein